MENIVIILIEDQKEVLAAVAKDIDTLEENFVIEECDSAAEAEELMEELDAEGEHIALIISDHIMPGKSGVDFLIEIISDFAKTLRHTVHGICEFGDLVIRVQLDSMLKVPSGNSA